ncbi:MAG: molybdenum cofactor guanylyltransferase [Puniceicoccaceae bacterium]|nr:MAG: molybdenum cofactor guanylyltransferase [Puniceicoccaceae bacterium]
MPPLLLDERGHSPRSGSLDARPRRPPRQNPHRRAPPGHPSHYRRHPMSSDGSTPFAAAVLAGGASTRMGRDKAFLDWQGRRLIDLQLDRLRALQPAELFLSGRPGVDYGVKDVAVITDRIRGAGPLAGLEAILDASTAPHVLVLAIDLPEISTELLQDILGRRRDQSGVVPRREAGWEPLVAVYPRRLHQRVHVHLACGRRALHKLVDEAKAEGEIDAFEIPPEHDGLFLNLNTPEDLTDR